MDSGTVSYNYFRVKQLLYIYIIILILKELYLNYFGIYSRWNRVTVVFILYYLLSLHLPIYLSAFRPHQKNDKCFLCILMPNWTYMTKTCFSTMEIIALACILVVISKTESSICVFAWFCAMNWHRTQDVYPSDGQWSQDEVVTESKIE